MLHYIEGDLMEVYGRRVTNYGKRKADILFIIDVLLLFRPGIIRPAQGNKYSNNYSMYKNYIKIGWRNLVKNKGYSFINIGGLALGLTTCVLIMLYVADEMTYDKHYADGHRIYRIASITAEKYVTQPAPVAEALKRDFPEVEQATRLLKFPGIDKMLLENEAEQKRFFEVNAFYVDSTFFDLFNYEFKFGDRNTALDEPNTIVISGQVAEKFFGDDDPVDKVLKVTLPFGNFNYTVKGVFNNTKNKSHIPANVLMSMNNSDVGGWFRNQTNWAANNIFHTYVKLKESADPEFFESKLQDFLERNGGADFKAAGFSKSLFIQPLEDIYLHSNFAMEIAPNGNIRYLYIFASIALFVLLIACINFMNLSTARSEKRAKEVGMRKVVGAVKGSLIQQFLTESLIMSLLAFVLACILIQLALPAFNQLTNKVLSVLDVPGVYTWIAALAIGTGFLAGIYPAFYLSSFKPIYVLKGKLMNTISAVAIRKGLVIFQFTISITLILGAILITRQMDYLGSQNLGFDRNQKIILPVQTSESGKNVLPLKNELLTNTQVISVASGATYPGIENLQEMLFYAEGKDINENVAVVMASAGDDYVETLGIELLTGRSFTKAFTSDSAAVVLNESAVKHFGYTVGNAVGRNIFFEWQNKKYTMNIIGVVKDYHFQSLHQEIKPMALTIAPIFEPPNGYLIVHVKSNDYPELIASFQKSWAKINPHSPFEYSFLDQDFQKNYEKDNRTAQLIRYFTVIAVVIACLGLFGLATFTAEQRRKEIGVRKVLGAGVAQLVALLSGDFIKLVTVAIVLAIPVAYYMMNTWLQSFAYRIDMEWWVFVVAGLIAILIALFTVSFQAIRASMVNPVKSLRSE